MKHKGWILGLCLLVGCTPQTTEPEIITEKTTLFQKVGEETAEKIVLIGEQEAKVVRNPDSIRRLGDYLNGLSTSEKTLSEESIGKIEVVYKDQSSQVFEYDQESICLKKVCAAFKQGDFQQLIGSFNDKRIVYSELPAFLAFLESDELSKAVIMSSCEEKVCEAMQIDSSALFDFQWYLRMLEFGKEAEAPETISDSLLLTTSSKEEIVVKVAVDEQGRKIGVDDEWVDFNYSDISLKKQLSAMPIRKVQAENPFYRPTEFFTEGIGELLELAGYAYDEEALSFTMESGSSSVRIDSQGIELKEKEATVQSYQFFSEVMNWSDEESSCTYFINAQESEGCELEQAQESSLELRKRVDDQLSLAGVSLGEVKQLMLDLSEEKHRQQMAETLQPLAISKPMLGNVTDFDELFTSLGYTVEGTVYSGSFQSLAGEVMVAYDALKQLFTMSDEEMSSSLRLNSTIAEGTFKQNEGTVCTIDTASNQLIGECAQHTELVKQGGSVNVRYVLEEWLAWLNVTPDELIQYSAVLADR